MAKQMKYDTIMKEFDGSSSIETKRTLLSNEIILVKNPKFIVKSIRFEQKCNEQFRIDLDESNKADDNLQDTLFNAVCLNQTKQNIGEKAIIKLIKSQLLNTSIKKAFKLDTKKSSKKKNDQSAIKTIKYGPKKFVKRQFKSPRHLNDDVLVLEDNITGKLIPYNHLETFRNDSKNNSTN
ncbi:glutathione S-transferase [Sarcoptes scabiei]|nr:glutathione S-transferase [Sarcoptes scabiei]